MLFLAYVGEALFEVLPGMWWRQPAPGPDLQILQLQFPRWQEFLPGLAHGTRWPASQGSDLGRRPDDRRAHRHEHLAQLNTRPNI